MGKKKTGKRQMVKKHSIGSTGNKNTHSSMEHHNDNDLFDGIHQTESKETQKTSLDCSFSLDNQNIKKGNETNIVKHSGVAQCDTVDVDSKKQSESKKVQHDNKILPNLLPEIKVVDSSYEPSKHADCSHSDPTIRSELNDKQFDLIDQKKDDLHLNSETNTEPCIEQEEGKNIYQKLAEKENIEPPIVEVDTLLQQDIVKEATIVENNSIPTTITKSEDLGVVIVEKEPITEQQKPEEVYDEQQEIEYTHDQKEMEAFFEKQENEMDFEDLQIEVVIVNEEIVTVEEAEIEVVAEQNKTITTEEKDTTSTELDIQVVTEQQKVFTTDLEESEVVVQQKETNSNNLEQDTECTPEKIELEVIIQQETPVTESLESEIATNEKELEVIFHDNIEAVKEQNVEEKVSEKSHKVLYPPNLLDNLSLFDENEKQIVHQLVQYGQQHLFNQWDAPGVNDEKKKLLLGQIKSFDEILTPIGGLEAYIQRAKVLFNPSVNEGNTYDGVSFSVPQGIWLDPSSPSYTDFETKGFEEIKKSVFVIVAGGLSERLGLNYTKATLPTETTTNTSFLELCITNLLAYEKKFAMGAQSIPLLIMASDNTITNIVNVLENNNYFGMPKSQITIVKQDQVPAFKDSEARLATSEDGYRLESKPHGHGDIHSLLYRNALAQKWLDAGFEWMVILQDNNSLGFFSVPTCLGVSKELNLEVNIIAVPRKAKQPLNPFVKCQTENGKQKAVVVKYDELDKILRSTLSPMGDTENPATGYSIFPGSTNQLIFKLSHYVEGLKANHGIIGESACLLYADESCTTFRRPVRLEAKLQDYLKTLHFGAKVGFTGLPEWLCYSPVKNNWDFAREAIQQGHYPALLATAEADRYRLYTNLLKLIGVGVGESDRYDINGFHVDVPPRVIFDPFFISSLKELQEKFPEPTSVSITPNSSLVVSGSNVKITTLNLSGCLVIDGNSVANVHVSNSTIENAGRQIELISLTSDQPDHLKLRGFTFIKGNEQHILATNKDIVVETINVSTENNKSSIPLCNDDLRPSSEDHISPSVTNKVSDKLFDQVVAASQPKLVVSEEKIQDVSENKVPQVLLSESTKEFEVETFPKKENLLISNQTISSLQVPTTNQNSNLQSITNNNNTQTRNESHDQPITSQKHSLPPRLNSKTEEEIMKKMKPKDAQSDKCTCVIS